MRPKAFRGELKRALDSLTRPDTALPHSYIHRNFYYRLRELSPQPGLKIVLAWTDLIVNDRNVNFYDYQKHPERIWEERDSLIARMTTDYSLADFDLKGIKIIIIHQPSKELDELRVPGAVDA